VPTQAPGAGRLVSNLSDTGRRRPTAPRSISGGVSEIEPRGIVFDPRDPLPIARGFLEHTGTALVYQAGVFYRWAGAAYRELHVTEVRSDLYAFLET